MSTPDDEYKTVGLPPGARDKLLKEIERDKKLAAGHAAGADAPAGPRPPAPPPRPASAPERRKPTSPPPIDPGRESFETIPPVGGFPLRREVPGHEDLTPKGPRNQGPPPQPWDAGGAAHSPPASSQPPRQTVHSGWTMAEPSPVELPTPWDEREHFDPFQPPPKKAAPKAAPPPHPAPVPPKVDEQARAGGWPAPEAPPAAAEARPMQPSPFAPPRPPAGRPPEPDASNRTIAYDRNLHGSQKPLLTLQFYNTSLRRWSDLGQVRGEQLELGRSAFQDWNPNPTDLAERHVRLVVEGDRLLVQPLPSLNGVYIKLKPNSPVELAPHARFRVGRHVLEFRPGEPAEEPEARRADDGEVFQSRMLAPLGFIDLIGPDDGPYLSYPLTKPDEPGTRIGRGGPRCDLALTGDDWASSEHARLLFATGKCWLEDLKSTNGTFVQITEPTPMRLGAAATPDRGDVVVIGGYMIRVVEERP